MASTLTNLLYHIVFTTKVKQDLVIPVLSVELYPYIGRIIHEEKGLKPAKSRLIKPDVSLAM